MKALLICPDERCETSALTHTNPPATIGFLGKPFVFYWIEHLAALGATKITLLASDRPEQVRAAVGDGHRWGVELNVVAERRELDMATASAKYKTNPEEWLPEPNAIIYVNHPPAQPKQSLFKSYEAFFNTAKMWLPQAITADRIGMKEMRPGIWVGMHTRISPEAKLVAPCWIGDNVCIGPGAVVGPVAILENRVVVSPNATVTNSFVGCNTFVGDFTALHNSIAIENRLANWTTNSSIIVTEPFLLSSLGQPGHRKISPSLTGRLVAVVTGLITSPILLKAGLIALLSGQRLFKSKLAATSVYAPPAITYYELQHVKGYWARWPQLWNIVSGKFSWFGNRPISGIEVAMMSNDFEKLWLMSPIGLFSQADAYGCFDTASDEAKAHAAFYSTQANWHTNLKIFLKVLRNWRKPGANSATGSETEPVLTKACAIGRAIVNFLLLRI
jgi:hypothetical protein